MKKVMMLMMAMLFFSGISMAQTTNESVPSTQANKGQGISNLAKTTEGGKEKGKIISSAARRSEIRSEKAEKASEKSEKASERAATAAEKAERASERAALGAENAEAGKNKANQMRPQGAGQGGRPNVQVPAAQPNTPVGKPANPGSNGRRPATAPGKPSGN